MRAAPTVVWGVAFAAYSWSATTIWAAWFARRLAHARGVELSLNGSLTWQGAVYAAWLPAGVVVWRLIHRFGAGGRGVGVAFAAGVIIAPVEALVAATIDRTFTGGGAELAGRVLERTPVCILIYTAIVAVGLAAAHRERAREARAHAHRLETALAEARAVEPAPEAERLMVMAGSRRVPVEIGAIEWLGAADNYVVVHWAGREGLLRATLQSLEARLDPRVFARAHRSALVNLARVRDAQPLSDGSWRLTLESGDEVVTSRTYRDALLARLGR